MPLMKKYIVFGFFGYYPSGGMDDLRGDFDSLAEVREFMALGEYDYYHVVDRDTWERVVFAE
jgi:hypothetical protein